MDHKIRHRAELAHHSNGRMRIRVPSAKGDPEALEEIRRALTSVSGVSQVKVNDALGTVTIHYDHSAHDEIQQHLTAPDSQQKIKMADCPKLSDLTRVDQMLENEVKYLTGHSHTAEALMQFVNQLDTGIKRATGNAVDLKVIAPLALAAGALTGLGVAAATPVWLTLSLFSFNHFIDLHAHHGPDKDATSKPGDEAPNAPRPRPQ